MVLTLVAFFYGNISPEVHFWDTQDEASTSWVTDIVQLPNIVHILLDYSTTQHTKM